MSVHVAVVGHVEWAEFVHVPHVPAQGEIVHADDTWEATGGGGAVAAIQLAKLAGEAAFFTALADDDLGRASARELHEHGVEVFAALRPAPQRRALVHVDDQGERTITVIGERIVPHGDDDLPWYALSGFDGVYFTGGDPDALRHARAARVLVATPRAAETIVAAGVALDVLVSSASDPGEEIPAALDPAPGVIVQTEGADGGSWRRADGTSGRWAAAPLQGERVDAYGCGDSFASGLTYGLAAGLELPDALDLAARCGACALCGRGPTGGQLSLH